MCIKENYNEILKSNDLEAINIFIDNNCKIDGKDHCCKICGGCDYLGFLEDNFKKIERGLK